MNEAGHTGRSGAGMTTSTDHLRGLNPRQQEAVKAVDGPLLIVAGPGSGKTRVITHRIAYLDSKSVPLYRIAAVTFTNKAAREMHTRLFGSSPEDSASPLLGWGRRDEGLTVSTFHAFCSRLLRVDGDHIGLDRGFAIYDSADQLAAVKRAMDEVDVDQKTLAPRGALSAISSAKSKLIGVEGFGLGMKSYIGRACPPRLRALRGPALPGLRGRLRRPASEDPRPAPPTSPKWRRCTRSAISIS